MVATNAEALAGLRWMRSETPPVPSTLLEVIERLYVRSVREWLTRVKKAIALKRSRATSEDARPKDTDVLLERKWDGVFLRVFKDDAGRVFACTKQRPAVNKRLEQLLAIALRRCPNGTRLDAEFVALNPPAKAGSPSPDKAQAQESRQKSPTEAGSRRSTDRALRADRSGGPENDAFTVYIHDCPIVGGEDLRGLPLRERKAKLLELRDQALTVRQVRWMTLDSPWVKRVDTARLFGELPPFPHERIATLPKVREIAQSRDGYQERREAEREALAEWTNTHLTSGELAEGFLVKRMASAYDDSKRSVDWVKYKPESSGQFLCIARVQLLPVPPGSLDPATPPSRPDPQASSPARACFNRPAPPPSEAAAKAKSWFRRVITLPGAAGLGWQRCGEIGEDASFNQAVMAEMDALLLERDVCYVVLLADVRPARRGNLLEFRFARPKRVIPQLEDASDHMQWLRTKQTVFAAMRDRSNRVKATWGERLNPRWKSPWERLLVQGITPGSDNSFDTSMALEPPNTSMPGMSAPPFVRPALQAMKDAMRKTISARGKGRATVTSVASFRGTTRKPVRKGLVVQRDSSPSQ